MTDYASILTAASQLPLDERLRLIDDLCSSIPVKPPPQLSPEWMGVIERRSREIDEGTVETDNWEDVRARLFERFGADGAD